MGSELESLSVPELIREALRYTDSNHTPEPSQGNRTQRLDQLAAIVEYSSDAVITLTPEGVIHSWNRGAAQIYGYDAGEIIGKPVTTLFPPGAEEESNRLLDIIRSGTPSPHFESTRLTRTGRRIEVSTTLSPIHDENGRVAGAFTAARDITERKRTENVFRHAVESAPNAMLMINGHGKIVLVNAQTEKLFAYRRDELLGQSVELLVPPRFRDKHPGYRQSFSEEPRARAMGAGRDLFGLRKDGVEFPVEIGLNPIETDEGLMVLSAIVDITERKRGEEEIKRVAAELARSNAELQQFAYVASHDLQEPMRAVAGCVQLLQQRYAGQLDSGADEIVKHIVDAAVRMQTMINDLLALSRQSTQPGAIETSDSAQALDTALKNLEVAIRESNAAIHIGTLPVLRANPTQMVQLFQNLLANAIKFRGEQPLVIHIGAEHEGNEWHFRVSDNGIGMDPKYRDRIFGIFQRLHAARKYPGTGIGLAICKKIIERHNGRIWVETEPGKGSTFHFTLPNRS